MESNHKATTTPTKLPYGYNMWEHIPSTQRQITLNWNMCVFKWAQISYYSSCHNSYHVIKTSDVLTWRKSSRTKSTSSIVGLRQGKLQKKSTSGYSVCAGKKFHQQQPLWIPQRKLFMFYRKDQFFLYSVLTTRLQYPPFTKSKQEKSNEKGYQSWVYLLQSDEPVKTKQIQVVKV